MESHLGRRWISKGQDVSVRRRTMKLRWIFLLNSHHVKQKIFFDYGFLILILFILLVLFVIGCWGNQVEEAIWIGRKTTVSKTRIWSFWFECHHTRNGFYAGTLKVPPILYWSAPNKWCWLEGFEGWIVLSSSHLFLHITAQLYLSHSIFLSIDYSCCMIRWFCRMPMSLVKESTKLCRS